MTEHRDHDVARRLAELDAPDHSPDFWAAVRAAISTRQPSDADAHFVENGEPVVLKDRRRAVSPRIWLAAAALVVLALVTVGLLLDREAGETDVTTEPTPPSEPDGAPTDPDGPLRPVGEPIERGPGHVVGVDPAGQFLYVAEQDPAGDPGCEGLPAPVLLVEPIEGGERRDVLPPGTGSTAGGFEVRFGPEGEIAILTQCEGFGATIVTGTLAADGTLSEPTELEIPDLDLGRDVDGILDFEFRSARTLVAVTRTIAGDGTEHRHLYEFPVGPSEVTDLGQDDVLHLDVTADGRIATASSDGSIRFDGEIVAEAPGTVDFAISPDGDRLYVAGGSGGVVAVDIVPGNAPRLAPGDGPFDGVVDAPADGVVIKAFGESSWDVRAADPGSVGDEGLLIRSVAGSEVVVTPDLSRLFVTRWFNRDRAPVILEQRLTR